MALEFTDTNFFREVIFSDKLCVVDFWSEWCGSCAAMRPVIEALADEYAGKVNVGKINVDRNPYRALKYNITSLPVITFFRDGKLVYKHVGIIPKDKLDKEIQEYLKSPDKIQACLEPLHEAREWPGPPLLHPLPG